MAIDDKGCKENEEVCAGLRLPDDLVNRLRVDLEVIESLLRKYNSWKMVKKPNYLAPEVYQPHECPQENRGILREYFENLKEVLRNGIANKWFSTKEISYLRSVKAPFLYYPEIE